jgi:hypothetical protein
LAVSSCPGIFHKWDSWLIPAWNCAILGDNARQVVVHLPHSALELHHAETTTSASQPDAHLQAALVGQFPENHDIIEQ